MVAYRDYCLSVVYKTSQIEGNTTPLLFPILKQGIRIKGLSTSHLDLYRATLYWLSKGLSVKASTLKVAIEKNLVSNYVEKMVLQVQEYLLKDLHEGVKTNIELDHIFDISTNKASTDYINLYVRSLTLTEILELEDNLLALPDLPFYFQWGGITGVETKVYAEVLYKLYRGSTLFEALKETGNKFNYTWDKVQNNFASSIKKIPNLLTAYYEVNPDAPQLINTLIGVNIYRGTVLGFTNNNTPQSKDKIFLHPLPSAEYNKVDVSKNHWSIYTNTVNRLLEVKNLTEAIKLSAKDLDYTESTIHKVTSKVRLKLMEILAETTDRVTLCLEDKEYQPKKNFRKLTDMRDVLNRLEGSQDKDLLYLIKDIFAERDHFIKQAKDFRDEIDTLLEEVFNPTT